MILYYREDKCLTSRRAAHYDDELARPLTNGSNADGSASVVPGTASGTGRSSRVSQEGSQSVGLASRETSMAGSHRSLVSQGSAAMATPVEVAVEQ